MKIKVKKKINAPKEDVWQFLGDYSNIASFHPMLKGSHFIDENQSCEVGGTRQCDLKNGGYLKEEITEWNEGTSYSVKITESSIPVKSASATLGLKKLSENQTLAYMHLDMKPKSVFLRPMLYFMYKFYGAPTILKGLNDIVTKQSQMVAA